MECQVCLLKKKIGGKNKEELCTFLIMQYTNFIQICTEKLSRTMIRWNLFPLLINYIQDQEIHRLFSYQQS